MDPSNPSAGTEDPTDSGDRFDDDDDRTSAGSLPTYSGICVALAEGKLFV
jgi:hypothetical protein